MEKTTRDRIVNSIAALIIISSYVIIGVNYRSVQTYYQNRIKYNESELESLRSLLKSLTNDDETSVKFENLNATTSSSIYNLLGRNDLVSKNFLNLETYKQKYSASCEYASLHVAMSYYGVGISEDSIAEAIGSDLSIRQDNPDGSITWGNPQKTYIGDINTNQIYYGGYGIYNEPLYIFLKENGFASSLSQTNWKPEQIYNAIKLGYPVVVWISNDFSTQTPKTWFATDGTTHKWINKEHAVVLSGVDENRVYFMDVGNGRARDIDKESFERGFANLDNMAIIVVQDK
jgi:uncharacterized protein YvpB